ncbi:hypothetical protein K438DRAFT_1662307 [Mycena galopus ATCC 62051]|nr:hypothetical protein K438DRAFT_1662307 [Mycena galopus ATCC 62051]
MASTSSHEEDYDQEFARGKKRRLARACDLCRRRKTGCDGSQMPGEKCTTCISANVECTYEATVKRRPPKSYLDLEKRLEKSEALVRQLRAELSNKNSSSSPTNLHYSASETTSAAHSSTAGEHLDVIPSAALCVMRTTFQSLTAQPAEPHEDGALDITSKLEGLRFSAGPLQNPFFGKSSGAVLLNAALDLKGRANRQASRKHHGFLIGQDNREKDAGTWRRPRYWTWQPPRDNIIRHTPPFTFPPPNVLADLIQLYFTRQAIYLPLMHRPTFERGVAEGLHLRDDGFAGNVLLVCAIGSRWSTDPSVVGAGLDCGWGFFNQIQLANHLMRRGTLYDLQHYCLATQFLFASMPQAGATLAGFGLRVAEDLGVHRRNATSEPPSTERELLKRAFWVLVYFDRIGSCALGHACSVGYSDFDVDLPLEVDDEYWEDPAHPFQQPPLMPSRVTYFNTLMRLNHILGFSMQILYPLKKVRTAFTINDAWNELAIAELDSALNVWRDQIPEHLRWDPARQDTVFFNQSAFLHCSFYFLQIVIHRLFIPQLRSAPTVLPALTICMNAARSCANVVDIQRHRAPNVPIPLNLNHAFTAGLVLSLNMLSGKRSGLVPDPKRELANVWKCIEAIHLCEGRWPIAGMLWDIMTELASVTQLPVVHVPTPTHAKWNHPQTAGNRSEKATAGLLGDVSSSADHNYTLNNLPASQSVGQFSLPSHYGPYPPTGSSQFEGLFVAGNLPSTSFAPAPAPVGPDNIFAEPYTRPEQTSSELESMMDLIDRDILDVWSNAPMGLGDNWEAYFSNLSDMSRGSLDK